jgi:hypothetical protein
MFLPRLNVQQPRPLAPSLGSEAGHSTAGILKSIKLVWFLWFFYKIDLVRFWKSTGFQCKQNIVTVATIFDWFLHFINRFISILKIGTISVFESLFDSNERPCISCLRPDDVKATIPVFESSTATKGCASAASAPTTWKQLKKKSTR